MGSGHSKQSRKKQSKARAPVVIGAPQDVMFHVPRNRTDPRGVPIQQVTRDMDRDTLLAALHHVSKYVSQRKAHITVVGVGGAVNTLYLRSRATTHDVDLFGSDFNNKARMLLDEAMQSAQQRFPGLGTDWLNTETQMWMPGPLHGHLTAAAKKQNVKVFEGAGLTILAAPWEYAFSAKVDRILKGGDHARPYDLADAATYIHEYIRGHGNQPLPFSVALNWARQYNLTSSERLLRDTVNPEYKKRNGGRPAFV